MFTTRLSCVRRARGRRRGFTLVELLVVMGIITILASLLLPVIISALAANQLTSCITQLKQMGFAQISYYKDYDFWMVSCGHDASMWTSQQPFIEPPYDRDATAELTQDFPYWYESLAPYVNPAATRPNAIRSYCDRTGLHPLAVNVSQYKREIARLCMLYTCPAKKQSPLGYGYNYCAPYGESILYPMPSRYRHDYPRNCDRNDPDEFCWPYGLSHPVQQKNHPVYQTGEPAPIPILWYGQSAHFSSITTPSTQIAICDTGLVTNDNQRVGYNPASDWIEHGAGEAAVNEDGYTRYPINQVYTKGCAAKPQYKTMYEFCTPDPDGMAHVTFNFAWHPVPRHNGRTACLFFDGGVQAINVMDIVSHEWGDRACIFDNRPPRKPPAPKKESPYDTIMSPLPDRPANGVLEALD